MRLVTAIMLVICGCSDGGAGDLFPAPADLPAVDDLPTPFTTFDGVEIETAAQWQDIRRPELIVLFQHYIYGYLPQAPEDLSVSVVASAQLASGVDYEELEVRFGPGTLYLATFRPAGDDGDLPVILALNPCGNHSTSTDEAIRRSTSWSESACGEGRGTRDMRWPIEAIVERGYVLATFHQSDVARDDATTVFSEGVFAGFDAGVAPELAWGAVAAWSFGLSRAVDALSMTPGIDAARIAVTGHSRRGKAALLAAAFDDRIAVAIPHQSGTAGATLSRSYLGESVAIINFLFPHWFNDVFPEFSDAENKLPVDQHLLIGLVAPRPVLVSNGDADDWADPPGALAAVQAADPIYEILGSDGLITEGDAPVFDADLSWVSRPGGHSLEASDWSIFLDFLDGRWP